MKLLFLHGLASSGAYKMASTLRILLRCEVLAPDLPIEPDRVEALLADICLTEHPDLVVGLSWGGFWAQKLRGLKKVLVNPDFHVSRLMRTKLGFGSARNCAMPMRPWRRFSLMGWMLLSAR